MEKIEQLSLVYFKLLKSIDWSDDLLTTGLKEGLGKFLSNAYIAQYSKNKYLLGHYYSNSAYEKVQSGDFRGLVFEHMVPKRKYIQEPCEIAAKSGLLTQEMIQTLLSRYWKIAVITSEEDALLESTRMPKDWDGNDIFFRYVKAKIKLLEHRFL